MDVVDAIIADHVRFESLLRRLRARDTDPETLRTRRPATRQEFADLLVGHATAEESEVYPKLRTHVGDHVEHGADEHVDGHRKLLALLDVDDVLSAGFDRALGKLANSLAHHVDEEERTLLNDAREHLDAATRESLGIAWLAERDRLIAESCGSRDAVAALLP
ncbi:hemerythrin domain-containing protein [Dactylosporangium fulvum]|uniref:Hemerythrin domain-containing protein n=1 Tax=Dactylosporangium fulvum TaxID=53359 RepID=A0ABY5VTU8_9ACTN|nr:hemerythrin domain-containing protein [Dactylosporangium fulvum]UWP80685.1 hemerythrin domain-containing protein [Dactylosporangium fulvum]